MAIIKSKEEINKLEKAAKLGLDCFYHTLDFIKPGITERKIASIVDDFFIKNGASSLSFDTIVGSGVNSCQIHSTPSDKIINENDIILFDMGCILDGYCSDMSRTVFVGKPTEKQATIYDLVYRTYLNAISNIKVGLKANEADSFGRKKIIDAGYDYAHALGHGVGQEVHEDPLLSPKRDSILEENMVFSIEPGVYIKDEFGVRIEDVGVLTADGMRMFTKMEDGIIIL